MILDKAVAVLKKDVLTALRYRNGFVLNGVSAFMQLGVFYYLARSVGPQFCPEGMPYFAFLLIGTGFYGFLSSAMHGFLRTIQDAQQSGTLEVLMTSSTPPAVLLFLSAISAFAGAFVQLAIYGIAGFVFLRGFHFFSVLLVLMPSSLIAVAIGMIAASLQISLHKGSAALWALGSASWLMAGTLFPVAALPAPVRALSNLLPFTHALTGMRLAMTQPIASGALRAEIVTLLIFAIFLLPLSAAFFSWTVRRARQLGTLSFS